MKRIRVVLGIMLLGIDLGSATAGEPEQKTGGCEAQDAEHPAGDERRSQVAGGLRRRRSALLNKENGGVAIPRCSRVISAATSPKSAAGF